MSLEREPPLEGVVVDDDEPGWGDHSGGPSREAELLRSAPAVARMAAGMWWRATRWGLAQSAHAGGRLARAAADPSRSARALDEMAHELRGYARDLLGITELDERIAQLMPPRQAEPANGAVSEREGLRRRGAQLLRQAARIEPDDRAHPAYARILTELAPDEGRILRLLATEGSQPAVDVRAANLFGMDSELVAGGVNTEPLARTRRTPDEVRGLLSSYHRGVRRGRAQTGADGGQTDGGFPPMSRGNSG